MYLDHDQQRIDHDQQRIDHDQQRIGHDQQRMASVTVNYKSLTNLRVHSVYINNTYLFVLLTLCVLP